MSLFDSVLKFLCTLYLYLSKITEEMSRTGADTAFLITYYTHNIEIDSQPD